MELDAAMRTTGAARELVDEPVDDATLYRILDRARFAPSGGNRQPWTVLVVRDPELRVGLRDLAVLGAREYAAYVERGLVPFAPGEDGTWSPPDFDLAEARESATPWSFAAALDRVPVLLVLLADLRSLAVLDVDLDRQSVVGGASVYPFAQNLLLAAREEGLGGVLTTFLCRQEPEARELLGFPRSHAIAGMLALGRPAHQVSRLRRRPVEEFTRIDTFTGAPFTG